MGAFCVLMRSARLAVLLGNASVALSELCTCTYIRDSNEPIVSTAQVILLALGSDNS